MTPVDVDALRTSRLAVVGLDTTTGLLPLITEVAVYHLNGPAITAGPFAFWAAPDAPLHDVRVTSWPNVRQAPPWDEVAELVVETIDDRIVVVHDVDRLAVLRRHLPDWQPAGVAYTRELAEQVWPGLAGYTLDPLAAHASAYQVSRIGPGAVAEAQAVALLLGVLLRDAGQPRPPPEPA